MEVIYWQLTVLFSVALTFALGSRRAAFVLCLGWTAWSIAMINQAGLFTIQALVAWGTWFACNSFRRSNRSIENLNRNVEQQKSEIDSKNAQIDALQDALRAADAPHRFVVGVTSSLGHASPRPDQVRPWRRIQGAGHIPELLAALRNAESELCVTSGWLGSTVLSPDVINEIKNALGRRVDIYLGYGWQGSNDTHQESDKSKRALEQLASVRPPHASANEFGNLIVGRYANHEKVIVKDDDFTIVGSYNWLSNLHGKDVESSVVITDAALAREESGRIKAMVVRNAVLINRNEAFRFPFLKCPKCAAPVDKLPELVGYWDGDMDGGRIWGTKCNACNTRLSLFGPSGIYALSKEYCWTADA